MFALGSQGSNHGGNRLKKAKLACLAKYPFLADLPQLGISILDLQFHEAEILRLAMEHLMQQDIGFLPVHDALLVAEGNEEVAVAAIRAAYMQYFTANLGLPSAPVPRVKHDRMARAAFAPDGAQGLSIGLRVPEGAIRLR